ncbi:MAG: ATP-grasp domain-containing protein [Marinilabiliales bacterium]|nr:MAG: ATP-grasp domain-containing protein [Marinilabiliales bacterium]
MKDNTAPHTTFRKILIANRGEIAARIIRTAHKMGIATVAVYAAGERDALHARMASEAYELEGSSLADTYLNANKIIDLAKKTGATAIHPGYGFMSENEQFAAACEKAGITFIGPGSEAIALMGNKKRAREAAIEAGLPVIKAYTGTIGGFEPAASELSYPLLVKAAAGGGGKGMRIVRTPGELGEAVAATSREAEAYFGDGAVYIEQYIESPRHIEVQVMADHHGNTVHLFERECSIQRRYQKIVEEAPSPSVTPAMRQKMGEAAVALAKSIGYRNAGTIEFLADPQGNFYFLEMNTRIQVEHPVTEMITGIDIVEEQIHIAAGHPLRFKQEDLQIVGHAIECRIYSEDPAAGFIPSPGRMSCYHEPAGEGIRVDSAFDTEGEVSDRYDPMISKLTTFGNTREEARQRMVQALAGYGIQGVRNNISFLLSLMHNNDFTGGSFSTAWCEKNAPPIVEAEKSIKSANDWHIPAAAALLASLKRKTGRNLVWDSLDYWRAGKTMRFCFEGEVVTTMISHLSDTGFDFTIDRRVMKGRYRYENKKLTITTNNESHNVFISENDEGLPRVTYGGFRYFFRRFDFLKKKDVITPGQDDFASGTGAVYSPMPGRIISINRQAGENFRKGDVLAIVESMKMENSILAPADGTVESINAEEGELIDGTSPLLVITV